MTPNVIVRPQARDDIDDQAEYLMVNANMESALRFLAAVDSAIAPIARQPYMGVRTEYLRDPLMETASSQSAGSRSISSFTVRLRTALKFSESFMAQGTFTLCSGMMLSLSTPPKYEMAHYIIGLLRKGPNWTASSTEETQRIQAGTSTSSLLLDFPRVRGPPMGAAQGCSPGVRPTIGPRL